MAPPRTTAPLLALALFALPASAQETRVVEGSLDVGDTAFEAADGRVADVVTFEAEVGHFVTVSLRSGAFDAFLRVVSPSGAIRENDDAGAGTDSELAFVADESGLWTVHVTAYQAESFGAYTLTWTATPAGETRTVEGRLSRTSPKGQPWDSATVELGGGTVLWQLSTGGDAFLTLSARGPDGRRRMASPSMGSAILTVHGVPAGRWTVWVAGESDSGVDNLAYTLTAVVREGGEAQEIEGRLEEGDTRLPLGEYADVHEFEVGGDGEVVVQLASDDFDTFLVVETAGATPMVKRNDDAEDAPGSVVTFTADEVAGRSGLWRVWVTSYAPEETGDYVLRIVR